MDEQRAVHVPVLLDRVAELLAPALTGRPAVLVDATLGLAGHSASLLAAHPELTVVGIDRDTSALRLAADRLAPFGARAQLAHAPYHELADVLAERGIDAVDGVLFDLGVSSMQLDEVDRGFAYARDAPLDMRMDQTTGVSAADVVNGYPPGDLVRILREYGEERFATRIVSAIVKARPVTGTAALVELIRGAIPAATRRTGGNPAKRTFQALRIEVNGELDSLRAALPAATSSVRVGGRIVVLAYQSLEDRMVKQQFTAVTRSGTPIGVPVEIEAHAPRFRLLTRGSEAPSEAAVADNPRAASARLRAVERVRADAA